MQRIKPPPSLKYIGFDVPNASLPQAVLSWLVTPRDNYAPECIVVYMSTFMLRKIFVQRFNYRSRILYPFLPLFATRLTYRI